MTPGAGSRAVDALWTPRLAYHFTCVRGRSPVAAGARRSQQVLQTLPSRTSGSSSDSDTALQEPAVPPQVANVGRQASPRGGRARTALAQLVPRSSSSSSSSSLEARIAAVAAAAGLAADTASEGTPPEQQQQQQQQWEEVQPDWEQGGQQQAEEEGEEGMEGPEQQEQLGRQQGRQGGKVTQTIFKLERRGEGWGEEIFPTITVEQRVVERNRRRYSSPDPWEKGSLEEYLVECGAPPADVDRMVTQAVAWRFTAGGRPLIDRRRRLRVERNVRAVVEYLEMHCGIPFGPKGIAAIFARMPEIMLCKPSTNDRWDRRAVELAAYVHRYGHANVPEDWEENPELGQWVKRQRVARAAGQLSEERLAILASMNFEFGEVAQMTDEWEHRFDQLIDWLLWHNENGQRFSWVGSDWGSRGGLTARELALWITLQREYWRRALLPVEALRRFEALHVQWQPLDGTLREREWMSWLGRLLYVIERNNTLQARGRFAKSAKVGRPKLAAQVAAGAARAAAAAGAGAAAAAGAGAGEEEDSEEEEDVPRLPRRGSAAVAAARQRLQQEVSGRRAALAAADLRCEPGLRLWLAKQRLLWRQRRLPQEQVLMLQLAGADMDTYTPVEWQAMAHSAAAFLQGSEIVLGLQQQQAQSSSSGGRGRPVASKAAAAVTKPVPRSRAAPPALQQAAGSSGAEPAATSAVGRAAALHAGSLRLRVRRWVQTQQALLADGRLSAAQLRYMTFLGITWVLSDEVLNMPEHSWQALLQQLVAAHAANQPLSEGLQEWLRHQHGLRALGWLPRHRAEKLEAAGAGTPPRRSAADRTWDLRLSQLLAFKSERSHCEVPESAGELAAWLAEQRGLLAAGRLPPGRAAQLHAIGAVAQEG